MTSETKARFLQMKCRFLSRQAINLFLKFLLNKGDLIAPRKKGEQSFSFEQINNVEDVVFDYPRTIQPLKKYFLPPRETLLKFDTTNNHFEDYKPENKEYIFFGVHSYEMQAVRCLDFSFAKGHPEYNYLQRRENALFIGISFTPDEWHFSKSVGIEIEQLDGFSLYLEPVENGFLVFEVDERGGELMAEFGEGTSVDGPCELEIVEKHFQGKIKYHYNRLPQVFEHVYHSNVWDDVAAKCVGCGTCNLLCPTCYCFDVRDEVEMNMTDGKRERFWDGCMLNTFAEVAGGENFRDKLHSRTRHRLYRKFKYITQESGRLHCVGCGRCTRYCPARISIIEIVNNLIAEHESTQQKQAV